jgi:hypothetical protein
LAVTIPSFGDPSADGELMLDRHYKRRNPSTAPVFFSFIINGAVEDQMVLRF